LLDEDSGGNARLYCKIEEALKAGKEQPMNTLKKSSPVQASSQSKRPQKLLTKRHPMMKRIRPDQDGEDSNHRERFDQLLEDAVHGVKHDDSD